MGETLGRDQYAWLRALQFPRELETEFRREYAEQATHYRRLLFGVVGFILAASLPVLWLAPGSLVLRPLSTVRTVACFLALFGLTFTARSQRWMDLAIVGLFLADNVLELLVSGLRPTPLPAEAFYYRTGAFFCIVVFFLYTTLRLRLLPATCLAWSYLLLLVIKDQAAGIPMEWLFANVRLGLAANLVGMLTCYFMEYSGRRNFLLSRLLAEERAKSERLLHDILPKPIADRLKAQSGTVADRHPEVTVLFADIVDFTPLAARLAPEETVRLLDDLFTEFDHLADRYGLEKIKTIGDAYMVVGSLPEELPGHASVMAEMALEMQEALARFSRERGLPLRMRIGMHTGPVVAGVIGRRKFLYDLWGDTVNLASRMESSAPAGAIQVSPELYTRLAGLYAFERREPLHVKGCGEIAPYLLTDRVPRAPRGAEGEIRTPV